MFLKKPSLSGIFVSALFLASVGCAKQAADSAGTAKPELISQSRSLNPGRLSSAVAPDSSLIRQHLTADELLQVEGQKPASGLKISRDAAPRQLHRILSEEECKAPDLSAGDRQACAAESKVRDLRKQAQAAGHSLKGEAAAGGNIKRDVKGGISASSATADAYSDYIWHSATVTPTVYYSWTDYINQSNDTSAYVNSITFSSGTMYNMVYFPWIDIDDSAFGDVVRIYDEFGYLCDSIGTSRQNYWSKTCQGSKVDIYFYKGQGFFSHDGFKITDAQYTYGTSNHLPVAYALASSYSPLTNASVAFSSQGSYDPDSSYGDYIAQYYWTFGDGSTSNDSMPYHTYTRAGTYTVVLKVTDSFGAWNTDSFTMVVSDPVNQAPSARISASAGLVDAGQSIHFDGSQSSDPEGKSLTYSWDFGDGTGATGVSADHAYGSSGTKVVTLTVTDDKGATGTDHLSITVRDPAPATGTDRYLVPAAGRTAGAFGSLWVTDVSVFNPTNASVSIKLEFLAQNQNNQVASAVRNLVVGPFATLFLDDVLNSQFSLASGNGAIEISHASVAGRGTHPLVITSRTFNKGGSSGTEGFFAPAQKITSALSQGVRSLQQLTINSRFRTNLNMVNLEYTASDLRISCFDSANALIGSTSVSFQGREMKQLGLAGFISTSYDDVNCEVSSTTGRVFAMASVNDNTSNDPIGVPEIALVSRPARQILASVGKVDGAFDSHWVTDMVVRNQTGSLISYQLSFYPNSGAAPVSRIETLAGYNTRRINDVIASFGLTSGLGYLQIQAISGEAPVVTARIYNDLGLRGTYGQFEFAAAQDPAIGQFSASTYQDLVHLVNGQIESSGSSFRTNVAIVNPSDSAVTVTIQLYGKDGFSIKQLIKTVPAHGSYQGNVFLEMGLSGSYLGVRAEVSSTAPVLAFASVVDNASNDPIFIPGVSR